MDRRNFIKISGVSIAGLIIDSPAAFANLPPQYLLALSDEVWINSGDQLLSLFSKDKLQWTNKDIVVEIKREAAQLGVYVQSPTLQLIYWHRRLSRNSLVLPDGRTN